MTLEELQEKIETMANYSLEEFHQKYARDFAEKKAERVDYIYNLIADSFLQLERHLFSTQTPMAYLNNFGSNLAEIAMDMKNSNLVEDCVEIYKEAYRQKLNSTLTDKAIEEKFAEYASLKKPAESSATKIGKFVSESLSSWLSPSASSKRRYSGALGESLIGQPEESYTPVAPTSSRK